MKNFNKILTYDYWHSDNPNYVKSKWRLAGIIILILTSILVFMGIRMTENRLNEKFNGKIEGINKASEASQIKTKQKLDSLHLKLIVTEAEVKTVKNELNAHSNNATEFQKQYQKEYNQLLKSRQDEKNYVTDATLDEQLRVIERAKYIPYQ